MRPTQLPKGRKEKIMNTTKSNVRFTINFFEQTITGTKASFNKASKGCGPEYEELTSKMAAHPTFTLVVKEQKHKTTKAKRTYDGMDFPFMEAYIATLSNAAEIRKEYNEVKAMADKAGLAKYPLTKKWFLGKFSTEEVPFDMDKAKEQISDYAITQAQAKAATTFAALPKTETTEVNEAA